MIFGDYTFFLMKDGSVKCCGNNQYGQLGLGDTISKSILLWHHLNKVKEIVYGLQHTFFIMEDGSIKCCGDNQYGQLGLSGVSYQASPVNCPLTGVKKIVCGAEHTFFFMEDGSIQCCGRNTDGILGLGNSSIQRTPITHPLTGVKDIVCGQYHTFFIMEDGSVKCCGNNQYGQLGLGYVAVSSPYAELSLIDLPFLGVKKIVCGNYHTFFIMEDGTIKCCGNNQYGQLGLGYSSDSPYAIAIVTNLPLRGVKDIVCGGYYTFFIMEDGTIKCCGRNNYGQLGLGNTNSRTSPVDHPLTGVRDIVCGESHTFFIMEDGTMKCCGRNNNGQLGLGNTTDKYNVVDISFGNIINIGRSKSGLIESAIYPTDVQEIRFPPIDTMGRAGVISILIKDSSDTIKAIGIEESMREDGTLDGGKLWSIPINNKQLFMEVKSYEI